MYVSAIIFPVFLVLVLWVLVVLVGICLVKHLRRAIDYAVDQRMAEEAA